MRAYDARSPEEIWLLLNLGGWLSGVPPLFSLPVLLAMFLAVNIFSWFADPSLGMAGGKGGQLIRSLVPIARGMGLYCAWFRDRTTYTRESTSASLRKQLEKPLPQLALRPEHLYERVGSGAPSG